MYFRGCIQLGSKERCRLVEQWQELENLRGNSSIKGKARNKMLRRENGNLPKAIGLACQEASWSLSTTQL